jgi:ATP-dependent RNA circularization protein (DNA/RNA ligase family)
MIPYPKTDNLYKRNPQKKSELLIGQYTRPEFEYINMWRVSEKVDGTNVQIRFSKDGLWEINGRTSNAQFTFGQQEYLDDLSFAIHQDVIRTMGHFDLDSMTLYGELYGPKIQAGGNYSDTLGFRIFDILVNDKTWLGPDSVEQNAKAWGIDMVPVLGTFTIPEIFHLVKEGFFSTFAKNAEYVAEGVVAVTPVPMYDQRGERIKWKLKTNDLRFLK